MNGIPAEWAPEHDRSAGCADTLDIALQLAHAGFKVFPLRMRSKLPLTDHGSHDASSDPEVISKWFGELWPSANLAMTLDNLVCVDIDPRNGGDADALPQKLPDTCYARTGGGGLHYLYRARPGVRYPGKLAPGIDLKHGAGSYICVEPSIHESGNKYSWLDESEPWSVSPALAPDWFTQVSAPKPKNNGDHIPEGQRNATLTSVAGAMRRRGASVEAITAALLVENVKCSPPLPEHEVRRIAESVARYEPEEPQAADTQPVVVSVLDPQKARVGDIFTVPPAPPRFTIENHLPQNVGTEVAAGGLGKTTRHQYEHVQLVNGLPLYGRRVLKSGAVLIVTKEDSREDLLFRYHAIATQMSLTESQRRAVMDHIYVEDLSGSADRLALSDRSGNLVSTDLAEQIVKAYAGCGLALLELDPLNFFGPGERFVNDGEAKLMEIGRYLARELGCTVRYTAHVSKEAARGRYVDAHAGRGGSAGGDNARFVHVFVPHTPKDDDKQYPMPAGIDPEVIAQHRLYRLHLAKVSGAPPAFEPIWLVREGFLFRHVQGAAPTLAARDEADLKRVLDLLAAEARRGVKHSKRSLEGCCDELALSRSRLRYVLHVAEQRGVLAAMPLEGGEAHGGKTHYLAPAQYRRSGASE